MKIARAYTKRDAVVVVEHGVPRPHEPHDGDDGEEHAVQELVRTVRSRGLPRADVVPVPRRTAPAQEAAARRSSKIEQGGRGRQRRRDRDRADPGRGRVHRSRARASCPRSSTYSQRQRHRVRRRRDPDRLRAHRRDVRVRTRGRRTRPDHHGEGHCRRPAAWLQSQVARRSWTRRMSAA